MKKRIILLPKYMWLLMPAFILIAFFLVYPTIFQLYLSFFSTTLYSKGTFIGLKNFIKVLTDPLSFQAARITAVFVILATTIEIAWGLILALALNKIGFGKTIIRGLPTLPLMLTPVAVGSIWIFMYFPEGGALSTLLRIVGGTQQTWLSKPFSALLAIVSVEVWQYTPFTCLVLLAGLQSIPQDLYEVALINGASKFQIFRYVTLPSLRGSLIVVLLFNIMRQLKTFDIVYTITKGGPGRATSVISFNIYQRAYRFYNISEAASFSFIFLIIVLLISSRLIKILKEKE